MQEIFKRAHNNKRQYFIEPFLIRSVRCKHEHFWRSFLSSPLILSRLTTAVVGFFVWQWQQVCDQISNLRLYYIDSGTQHHNKMNTLSRSDSKWSKHDLHIWSPDDFEGLQRPDHQQCCSTPVNWTEMDTIRRGAASYVSPEAQWHCGARPVGKRRFWPYGK